MAAAAGTSVRYTNSVLAEEVTSITRYIQERRLVRCRRALEDPQQAHRSLREIAYGILRHEALQLSQTIWDAAQRVSQARQSSSVWRVVQSVIHTGSPGMAQI